MGQKINPIGLRVGIIRDWEAKWYAEKDFASLLHEDLRIRKFIDNELKKHQFLTLKSNVLLTVLTLLFTLVNQVW